MLRITEDFSQKLRVKLMGGGGLYLFQQPSQLFQDLLRIWRPKHLTTCCCWVPNLCRGIFLPFQKTDISHWDVQVGRVLTYQQGREGRTMAPLTWFWPPPAQHQLTWKKGCWLLTGMPACSCWVEFKPCINYPNQAERSFWLLRFTFSSLALTLVHYSVLHKTQTAELLFVPQKVAYT